MKISFSTLGCPGWNLETMCQRGQEFGYQGIDFRGYLDELDITHLPMFTSGAAQTRSRLAEAGLETSGISSSIRVCEAEKLADNLEEARRTIAAAHGLGARSVRVFGGGDLAKHTRAELARVGRGCIEQILVLDGAAQLGWFFETHDAWVRASDCRLLLDQIPQPAFGALWDIGNTIQIGAETPAQTCAAIGPRIGYTHLKDAVYTPGHPQAMADGWRYVFPGQGQLPLDDAVRALTGVGYTGWLVYEHEKRWHMELPEPEEAFPAFAAWARKYR